MGRRQELNNILTDILGSDNVYYQPPESILMRYPAIVYGINYMNSRHANNNTYNNRIEYSITIIYTNPDSDITKKIVSKLNGRYNRHYVKDNLIHDVVNVYY